MKRSANATWKGSLREGQGSFSVASGAIKDQKVSFRTRFEDAPGTNPEELIAAAHAGCFAMQLSAFLAENGTVAEALKAKSFPTIAHAYAWNDSAIFLSAMNQPASAFTFLKARSGSESSC